MCFSLVKYPMNESADSVVIKQNDLICLRDGELNQVIDLLDSSDDGSKSTKVSDEIVKSYDLRRTGPTKKISQEPEGQNFFTCFIYF